MPASLTDTRSAELYRYALTLLPGGVNSPVRAMRAIGRDPIFIERGAGAELFDVDGNRYVDYVCSWGPLIHGHAHPRVLEAVTATAQLGTSFGAPTAGEVDLAAEIARRVDSVDMLRMTSSGTEATMTAVRLARAATGRERIVKFAGAYHGHLDGLLAQAGSGLATHALPSSPGVPGSAAAATTVLPWNDPQALLAATGGAPDGSTSTHRGQDSAGGAPDGWGSTDRGQDRSGSTGRGQDIAAILLEPLPANMGVVPPRDGFLRLARARADAIGALLIFDEVISGFRVAAGGAQELAGVEPDLTIMGKIVGGGLPAAALGGRGELMRMLAPAGEVYQAGTLSGNPLAVAAGLATLGMLDDAAYRRLASFTDELAAGLREAAGGYPVQIVSAPGLLTVFFSPVPVVDLAGAQACDHDAYATWCRELLSRGVYPPASQFEAWFPSLAHTPEQLDLTVSAATAAFAELA
jgi:glutamate-1-semialdehyde 2,1-aminomutase